MRMVKFIETNADTVNIEKLLTLSQYKTAAGLNTINERCGTVMDDHCDRNNYIVLETRANLDRHGIYIGQKTEVFPELVTDEYGSITLIFHRK
jgi:hypothetical protein